MSKADTREATKEAFSILSLWQPPLSQELCEVYFLRTSLFFDKHNGIPGKVQHFAFLAHVSTGKRRWRCRCPILARPSRCRGALCFLVILSRFSLDRKRLRSLLDDEVNFAVLGLVEVAQIEAVGPSAPGRWRSPACCPSSPQEVPLQKVESCIARRLRGQKPHVTEKEFEQIVLGVQRQRQLRRFNVVAGQPHAGVQQPT